MLKEFKEFAMRGNVVDMAIGIVGEIISLLVGNILTPPTRTAAWQGGLLKPLHFLSE